MAYPVDKGLYASPAVKETGELLEGVMSVGVTPPPPFPIHLYKAISKPPYFISTAHSVTSSNTSNDTVNVPLETVTPVGTTPNTLA